MRNTKSREHFIQKKTRGVTEAVPSRAKFYNNSKIITSPTRPVAKAGTNFSVLSQDKYSANMKNTQHRRDRSQRLEIRNEKTSEISETPKEDRDVFSTGDADHIREQETK